MTNSLNVTEKIRDLIEKSPAGGIFHHAELSEVGGGDFGGFADISGFEVKLPDGKFSVRVERT